MKMNIPVPVLFKGKTSRGNELKAVLTFVPATFEVTETSASLAPEVARRAHYFDRETSTIYRVFEDRLYARLEKYRGRETRNIEYDIARHLGELIYPNLEKISLAELHPRDAREIFMSITNYTQEPELDFAEYTKRASELMSNKSLMYMAQESPDFHRSLAHYSSIVADKISNYLVVDGVIHRRMIGMGFIVSTNYNQCIRIEETDLWTADKWRTHMGDLNLTDNDAHYFSSRKEAMAFAEEIGIKLNRRRLREKDASFTFLVPPENIPQPDMRYAELVRSAKIAGERIGLEVARRIRNQEASIFTDDRSLRYAFDKLAEALDHADPFGTPTDDLEIAVMEMLNLLERNKTEFDARYRNLISGNVELFKHLKITLELWENSPMEVGLDNRDYRGNTPGHGVGL